MGHPLQFSRAALVSLTLIPVFVKAAPDSSVDPLCGPNMQTVGDAWSAIESERRALAGQLERSNPTEWPQRMAAIAAHTRFIQKKAALLEPKVRKTVDAAADIIALQKASTVQLALNGDMSALAAAWEDVQAHLQRVGSQLPDSFKTPSKPSPMSAIKLQSNIQIRMLSDSTPAFGENSEYRFRLQSPSVGRLVPGSLMQSHGSLLHVLIVNQDLSDFQHRHPVSGESPGEWKFQFIPKTTEPYRAWIQAVPKDSETTEWIPTNLTQTGKEFILAESQKKEALSCEMQGIHASLEFPGVRPVPGTTVRARIAIRRTGSNVPLRLESAEESGAGVAVFSEDFRYASHTHVIPSALPTSQQPDCVEFEFAPPAAGFYRVFVEVRVSGEDLLLKFGVVVKQNP